MEIFIYCLSLLTEGLVLGCLSVCTIKQGIKIISSKKQRKLIRKNNLKYYDKLQDIHGQKFQGKTYAKFPEITANHLINILNKLNNYPEELINIVDTFKNYVDPLDLKNCIKNIQNCHIYKNKFVKYIYKPFKPSGVYHHEERCIELFNDKSFVLTHEFLHLASAQNEKHIGFHINIENEEIGRCLNEGYTELLNQRIYNNPTTCYKHNVRIMRMLETFFDNYRDMEHAFFHCELNTLYKQFCEYGTKEEFLKISQNLDYFAYAPIKTNDTIASIITQLKVYEIIKRSKNPDKIQKCETILDEQAITRIIRKGSIKLQTLKQKSKIKTLKNA